MADRFARAPAGSRRTARTRPARRSWATGSRLGANLLPSSLPYPPTPTETTHLTCANAILAGQTSSRPLVRDEEVVGSNPATPTAKYQVRGLIRTADQAPEWFPGSVWAEGTRTCAFANPAP
jgi:hypothetical protein